MAQVVKNIATLAEGLGPILSTHIKQLLTSPGSGSREPNTLFWPP